ncbi:Trk system potassium transporter TrkA [Aureimonas fodinaquatilis]|uniref:Trk system potassium uptake protein TrkA n=1 Tax=Aureimonas fodinaquatilis TaxID=2565783 RepID=A0A5B0DVH2_9HYPH|nr:Trk system potassium transporter TrkA [Aureimonas fodinaquatilis]KAA0970348.1 Trk system potassium transporter TrkA [Aureimonas fodinaquatilis]
MKVVICGAGQVGYGIAERLAAEYHDVSVIDTSPALVQVVRDTLDARGIVGHGAYPEVLQEAGADQADLLVAVTLHDEVNMVACQVAHSVFNIPTKIARIRSQSYLRSDLQDFFSTDHMPIDAIISPEREVGEMVLRRISLPGAMDVIRFSDTSMVTVAIECREDCPIVNKPLGQLTELFPDLGATVVGIWRGNELIVPNTADALVTGDIAYVVADEGQIKRTLLLFGHEEPEAGRIVIAGGGNIGLFVAQEMERRKLSARLRLIEANASRAHQVADQLNNTIVLNGSSLDQAILREADIDDADLMIALTNDDKVNILSSVLAKRLGCKTNLALINDPAFQTFTRPLGIDAYINPRSVTISRVLQHVRRGRIRSVHSILDGRAELIEADALETSPLVGVSLRELDLPDGLRIGAIWRNETFIRPDGQMKIKPRDRVVIFAAGHAVRKVEQLFRVSLEFF